MSAAMKSDDSGEQGVVARFGRLAEQTGLNEVNSRRLNLGLGWFSISLGLAQVLAPRAVARMIGASEDHAATLRMCGVRELAAGVALLSERAPAASAASRVAGDAMDLALLAGALRSPDARPVRLLAAATAVVGVMAVDMYAAGRSAGEALAEADANATAKVSLAINSTPEKLYEFWRNLENLPRFMDRLESVTRRDENVSHWVARSPAGVRVEWDSEIVDDQPGALLAWRTLPESAVQHHGSVRFVSAGEGHGSIVHVEMRYGALGGQLGAAVAKVLGEDPEMQMARDLRVLKQLMETGEVATTRGQPAGVRSLFGKTLTRREK